MSYPIITNSNMSIFLMDELCDKIVWSIRDNLWETICDSEEFKRSLNEIRISQTMSKALPVLPFEIKIDDEGRPYRWVTVHPWGDGREGVPIKLILWKRDKKTGKEVWVSVRGFGGHGTHLTFTDLKSKQQSAELAQKKKTEEWKKKTEGLSKEQIEALKKEEKTTYVAKQIKHTELTTETIKQIGEVTGLKVDENVLTEGDILKFNKALKDYFPKNKEKLQIKENISDLSKLAEEKDSLERDKKLRELIIKEHGIAENSSDFENALRVAKSQINDINKIDLLKIAPTLRKQQSVIKMIKEDVEAVIMGKELDAICKDRQVDKELLDQGIGVLDKDKAQKLAKSLITAREKRARELKDLGIEMDKISVEQAEALFPILSSYEKSKKDIKKLTDIGDVRNYDFNIIGVMADPEDIKALQTKELTPTEEEDLSKRGISVEGLQKQNIINDDNRQKILQKHLNDYEEALNIRFYDEADPSLVNIATNMKDGAQLALNDVIYEQTGNQASFDPETIELLGIEGTCQMTAEFIKQKGGELLDNTIAWLNENVPKVNVSDIENALEKAQAITDKIRDWMATSSYAAGGAFYTKGLASFAAKENLKRASILGLTAGKVQARASLLKHLTSARRETLNIPLGDSLTAVQVRMKRLGLNPGEFKISKQDKQYSINLDHDGMAKILKTTSFKQLKYDKELQAIKNGARNEKGWKPKGFSIKNDKGEEGELFPVQQSAIRFASHIENGVIVSGTGTGKTAIACGIHAKFRQDGRVKKTLYTTPSGGGRMLQDVETRAKQHLPGEDIYTIKTSKDIEKIRGFAGKDQGMLVISQDVLKNPKMMEEINKIKFDLHLIDESHKVISPGAIPSQRSEAARAISEKIPYKFALTADPIRNDLKDLAYMINLTNGDKTINIPDIERRYRTVNQGLDVSIENLSRQLQREVSPYVFNGGSASVEKHFDKVTITPSEHQVTRMRDIEDKYLKSKTKKDTKKGASAAMERRFSLRNIRNDEDWKTNAKITKAVDILKNGLEGNTDWNLKAEDQVVFFVQNNTTVASLKDALESNFGKEAYGIINDQIYGNARSKLINNFNTKKGPRFLILMPTAHQGISLHHGSQHGIIIGNPDTWANYDQMIGRIAREGSSSGYKDAYYVHLEDTTPLESREKSILENKKKITDAVGIPGSWPHDDKQSFDDAQYYSNG